MTTIPAGLIKLNPPNLTRIRPRPRLFARLDELRSSPILWVGGAPGAGKSALVASYLEVRGVPAFWYRLEVPGSEAGAGLQAIRELLAGLPPGGVLVLEDCDDYEASLPGLLERVGRELPPGCNIVLVGRGGAPSGCARLIISGALASLEASELALTLEETRELAAEIPAHASIIEALHRRCAGWVTGIAILLEGLRRHGTDPALMEHDLRLDVFGYLSAEAFEHAMPEERQVLVASALLARVSGGFAQRLSGQSEASAVLARIAGRGWFVAPCQGQPRLDPRPLGVDPGRTAAYEIVPAFREFLLERIEDSLSATALKALAARASDLLESSPGELGLSESRWLQAYQALRAGDRPGCRRLLGETLGGIAFPASTTAVCLLFPAVMSQLCSEALTAGIEPEVARRLIERFGLAAAAGAGREWPWAFKVHVLGRFRLLKRDAPIRFPRRAQRKPLELLQALIAFGGTEVGAGTLTDALWPDSEGDAGYHALETSLYRLRQLLGAADAVLLAGGKLSLDRSHFWVDMWEFEQEAQPGTISDSDVARRFARLRELYAGHFLEHESERPWALEARQALRDRFVRWLRDAARRCETRRQWQEAAKMYEAGIELDALAEDLYRGLMVCRRELGDHSEALQAYRRCRELLTRLLGIPPNAKTQAIYHSVRQSAVVESG